MCTGDIGRIDKEGFIHILDHRKELIKVKRIGVALAELEDLLLGYVDVEERGNEREGRIFWGATEDFCGAKAGATPGRKD